MLLANEQATANGKEQVLKALGEAATKIRVKLGESLASVQKYDAPAENVTTPSLEALQAYSLGYQAATCETRRRCGHPVLPAGSQPGSQLCHGLRTNGDELQQLGGDWLACSREFPQGLRAARASQRAREVLH